MVQPFVEEIRARGEWSLVFIDGDFTHAALKHPAAGDFRVQPSHGGARRERRPTRPWWRRGRRVLDALPVAPLYARIDGVETANGFVVMEVEAHEPGLFLSLAPRRRRCLPTPYCGAPRRRAARALTGRARGQYTASGMSATAAAPLARPRARIARGVPAPEPRRGARPLARRPRHPRGGLGPVRRRARGRPPHTVNLGGCWMRAAARDRDPLHALRHTPADAGGSGSLALRGGAAVENAWKALVARPRPEGPAYGFPSGHAAAAAVFAVVALYLSTRARMGAAAPGRPRARSSSSGWASAWARRASRWTPTGRPTCWAAGCSAAHAAGSPPGGTRRASPRRRRTRARGRPPTPSGSRDGGRTERMRPFVEIENVSFATARCPCSRASTSPWRRATSSASSGPTARARPRCSA